MPVLHGMEQDAGAQSCKQILDTLLFSLLAVILVFSLALICKVFRHLQRISPSTTGAMMPYFKNTLVDRHSTRALNSSSDQEGAEVALVGVWMSDDIDPKLIHRVPLSAIDTKILERFADDEGFLYVFSNPELRGEQKIRPIPAGHPAYHGY